MKTLLTIFCTLVLFVSGAQVSYEFKVPMPPQGSPVSQVSQLYFGQYRNEQTGTVIELSEQGVTMISTITSFITKEQFRESSRYQVRNGYIFGVHETDSLPCIFEDDKYYFGIQQKISLGEKGMVLKKISENTYVLNFKEGNGYTPTLLVLKGNSITLRHFDYPSETNVFDQVKQKSLRDGSDVDTWVLAPDQQEWDALSKQPIFDQELVYVK